jgi:hypothetical protein
MPINLPERSNFAANRIQVNAKEDVEMHFLGS